MKRSQWRKLTRHGLFWGMLFLGVVQLRAADVLLVERPSRLVVYNAYQQQASDAERRLLTPFVPLQILDPRAVMGDGFTVCMKVEAYGTVFFLLTEEGELAGGGHGATRLLRSVTMLGDTVRLRPGHSLAAEAPLGGEGRQLGGGTSLLRLFRSSDKTYVRRLEDTGGFGWVRLEESGRGSAWERVRQAAAAEMGITERMVTGVREALTDANNTLQALYAELNRESGRQLPPPVWQLLVEPDRLTCVLNGASRRAFQQSTTQLGRSLENLVLGTGYEVSVGEGEIAIRRKR